jgi:hypothetical protein
VEPRPPDHGRYGDNLKASPPNTSHVVNLIPLRRSLNPLVAPGELENILAISNISSESTLLLLPSSTHFSSSSHAHSNPLGLSPHHFNTNSSSVRPNFSSAALVEKSSVVNFLLGLNNSPLMLTQINVFHTFQLHLSKKMWPIVPKVIKAHKFHDFTCVSESQLDDVLPGSIATNFALTNLTCLPSSEPTQPSRNLPHFSSLKPPKYPPSPTSKKRFHLYAKFTCSISFIRQSDYQFSKKPKLDSKTHPSSDDEGDCQRVAYLLPASGDFIAAGVAHFNLPLPSQ